MKLTIKEDIDMNIKFIVMTAAAVLLVASCSKNQNEEESGYPAVELDTKTVTYTLDKVTQNGVDVKPYLPFFDGVRLSLSYVDGKPSILQFSEDGVPFSVLPAGMKAPLDIEWEIYSASSPYEIRIKGTETTVFWMDKDRNVSISFKLGAAANEYMYNFKATGE